MAGLGGKQQEKCNISCPLPVHLLTCSQESVGENKSKKNTIFTEGA